MRAGKFLNALRPGPSSQYAQCGAGAVRSAGDRSLMFFHKNWRRKVVTEMKYKKEGCVGSSTPAAVGGDSLSRGTEERPGNGAAV